MPKLSKFTAELRTRNIARPTQYYVEIVQPNIFGKDNKKFDSTDVELVSLWCHSASTPQSNILTRDDFLEAGTNRKYAYNQDYQNLTLGFYVDQEYNIKKFFDQWKLAIASHRRNFGYPADYTSEYINVNIINQTEQTTYKYEYSRIYPKSVNAVDLSYAAGGGVATFTVDFVFEEVYYSSLGDTGKVKVSSKPETTVQTAVPTTKAPDMASESGGMGDGEDAGYSPVNAMGDYSG